jgi:hypothetical protein
MRKEVKEFVRGIQKGRGGEKYTGENPHEK